LGFGIDGDVAGIAVGIVVRDVVGSPLLQNTIG